tara:strand:+ start:13170 stop:16145 length:2976 start_codon:yes stop_codon:yes gene_type:complete
MAAIDLIGRTVPNVILDTVILRSETGSDPTALRKIELRMHIPEYIYEDGTGTWYTNGDYKTKLKIRIRVETENGSEEITKSFEQMSGLDITLLQSEQKFKNIYFSEEIVAAELPGLLTATSPEMLKVSVETIIPAYNLSPPINFGNIGFTELKGKTSSVDVIANGNVLSRTVGYFLEGTFYNGPKTQLTNGRWVTGDAQNEASQFLIEREVPNIKVMDLRDTGLYQDVRYGRWDSGVDITKKGAYFSPMSTTRDTNGVARFLFTLDYKRAYAENSLWDFMFERLSENLQDRVLLWSSLRKLALKRVRVGAAFVNDVPQTIVSSGELSGDRFVDYSDSTASIKEEEFNFQKGTLFLRSFSGADKSFKDISFGEYAYIAEAEIRDGMYQFVSFQLEDLKKSYQLLRQYINRMQQAGHMTSDQRPTAAFNNKINAETDFLNRPYIRALVSMSEGIYFYEGRSVSEEAKILRTLRAKLSPVTSTLGTLLEVLGDMESVITITQKKLDAISDKAATATTQGAPFGNMVYSVEETFTNLFDATKSFKTGLSFLSATEILESSDATGLKVVSSEKFEKRVEAEGINFFNSKEPTFTIQGSQDTLSETGRTTSFTYLTPTSARVGNIVYAVGPTTGLTSTEGIDVTSLSLGDSKGKYKTVLSDLRYSRVTDSGVGAEPLTITPVSDPDFESIAPEGEPNPNNSAVDTIYSFGSSIAAESYNSPFEFLRVDKIEGDSVFITGITGQMATLTKEKFSLLPNYFKSILANSQVFGNSYSKIYDSASNGDVDPYSLIIGSVAKIEVLTGYKKENIEYAMHTTRRPEYMVREPIWEPLTYELYRRNSGTNLLCRLSKYDNNAIGFHRSNDAAIYNHYFVLDAPVVSTIYGNDGSNNLQLDLNGARSINDLANIFSNYGIDYNPGSGTGADDDIDFGADACAALLDEQLAEQMSGADVTAAIDALKLQPMREGDIAPFAGVLIDSESAEEISDVLSDIDSTGGSE